MKFPDNRVVRLALGALVLVFAMGLAAPLRGLRTFTVTCLTSATRISDGLGDISAFTVFNGSATPAFIGGSDVDNSTKGMPVCTSAVAGACYDNKFPVDGGGAYCLSTGGAVTLLVTAAR